LRNLVRAQQGSLNEKAGTHDSSGPVGEWSVLRYDPHRVNDAWDIAEDRQDDVYPKLLADPHLQEHSQRRENNRCYDAPEIHRISFQELHAGYIADK
jgi:hypothetical protein